jgi:mannose-6-phosphate isomerase-like protein (cupin superfamily)
MRPPEAFVKNIAFRLASGASLAALLPAALLLAACTRSPAQDPPKADLPPLPPGAGYVEDIAKATRDNENYRRVLATGPHMQLVLMSLRRGEEIGLETHAHGDQFIRVESGTGSATLNGSAYPLRPGTAMVIPAGVAHNVINTGSSPLRMYFLYSPPEHRPGTVQRTKAEAQH